MKDTTKILLERGKKNRAHNSEPVIAVSFKDALIISKPQKNRFDPKLSGPNWGNMCGVEIATNYKSAVMIGGAMFTSSYLDRLYDIKKLADPFNKLGTWEKLRIKIEATLAIWSL